MVTNFQKVKEMATFITKILNSQTGIIFQRSHMTSIIACEMAKNLAITEIKILKNFPMLLS